MKDNTPSLEVKEDGQIFLIPECPVEPKNTGYFPPHPLAWREYECALASAERYPVSNQDFASFLIRTNPLGTELKPGIYPIPGLKFTRNAECPTWCSDCKAFDWSSCRDKYIAIVSLPEKEESQKPKVVCFCGSTRFAQWFMIKRWELEKQGIITLGINILPDGYFAGENHHGAEQEGVKHILDELHLRKIDLSDEVFILNVDGYIGESTRRELEYALSIGKPVTYLENHAEAN